MSVRNFKYATNEQLFKMAMDLGIALTTGSTNALRNNHTGFLIETSSLNPTQIRQTILEVRYEIYVRGKATPADAQCLEKEPTDPRQEKIMFAPNNRGYLPGWLNTLCFPTG